MKNPPPKDLKNHIFPCKEMPALFLTIFFLDFFLPAKIFIDKSHQPRGMIWKNRALSFQTRPMSLANHFSSYSPLKQLLINCYIDNWFEPQSIINNEDVHINLANTHHYACYILSSLLYWYHSSNRHLLLRYFLQYPHPDQRAEVKHRNLSIE